MRGRSVGWLRGTPPQHPLQPLPLVCSVCISVELILSVLVHAAHTVVINVQSEDIIAAIFHIAQPCDETRGADGVHRGHSQ